MDRAIRNQSAGLLLAVGTGALLMYLLDPQQGRRRVALVRDKAVRLAHKGSDLTDAGTRDLAQRATGFAAGLRAVLRRRARSLQARPLDLASRRDRGERRRRPPDAGRRGAAQRA